MAVSFSTASIEESSQLDYWREVVCATFIQLDLESPGRRRGRFRGQITGRNLDNVQLATVTSEPHAVVRSPKAIRRSAEDDFFVNLSVHGRVVVAQDARTAILRPGDLAVYDGACPYRIACPDPFQLVVLKLPRRLLATHCQLPPHATPKVIRGDHRVGALLSPLLRSLAAGASELTPQAGSRVETNLLELLATAISDSIRIRPALPRTAQWLRARRYIIDHLEDPELSPATIAHALTMSVRYLHTLFQTGGSSPFRWILEQRLDRAARVLADPRQANRSVTEVAFAFGFKHPSHFTRAFKTRHGATPRDYRQARLSSQAVGHPVTVQTDPLRVKAVGRMLGPL